jgi:hypothetical protein
MWIFGQHRETPNGFNPLNTESWSAPLAGARKSTCSIETACTTHANLETRLR